MNRTEKILVVDDEFAVVRNVQKALESEDYDVVCCLDGDSALEHLRESEFHAVITDHYMPGTTGIEIVDYICQQGMETLVMLITSYHNNEEVLRRAKAYPRSMVLIKPIGAKLILEKLRELETRSIESGNGN